MLVQSLMKSPNQTLYIYLAASLLLVELTAGAIQVQEDFVNFVHLNFSTKQASSISLPYKAVNMLQVATFIVDLAKIS